LSLLSLTTLLPVMATCLLVAAALHRRRPAALEAAACGELREAWRSHHTHAIVRLLVQRIEIRFERLP